MTPDPGSWVKDALDFIRSKSSIKPLIAVFIISVFAIFARKWMEKIGMIVWIDRFWPWLVVCCTFSGLMLVISAGEHFGEPIVKRYRAKRRIETYFRTLSIEEITILQKYAESGKKTLRFRFDLGAVQNLVNAGILYRSGPLISRLDGQDCTVTSLAWPHMQRERFQKHLDRLTARQIKARQASIDERSNQKP
jgi:hypothetical protein